MDWIKILEIAVAFIAGGGLIKIFTLKNTVKKEEFELWKSQMEAMNHMLDEERVRNKELLDYERVRNKELMDENIARAKDKDKLRAAKDLEIEDKVKRLREAQDRECEARKALADSQTQLLDLTEKHGKLQMAYEKHRCHRTTCIDRQPPTEDTKKAIAEAAKKIKKETA